MANASGSYALVEELTRSTARAALWAARAESSRNPDVEVTVLRRLVEGRIAVQAVHLDAGPPGVVAYIDPGACPKTVDRAVAQAVEDVLDAWDAR